jgi:hypothetical protein
MLAQASRVRANTHWGAGAGRYINAGPDATFFSSAVRDIHRDLHPEPQVNRPWGFPFHTRLLCLLHCGQGMKLRRPGICACGPGALSISLELTLRHVPPREAGRFVFDDHVPVVTTRITSLLKYDMAGDSDERGSAEIPAKLVKHASGQPQVSILLARPIASLEVLNQPTARRPWRGIVAISRTHRHQWLHIAWQLDSNNAQFFARDVVFNHESRHVAEAEAGAQKSVSRAHISEPPCVFREHAIALAFGQR